VKRILVTGAAGFIGMHLSKKLLELGFEVIGLDNISDYYSVQLKQDRLAVLSKYAQFTFHKTNLHDLGALK
jgi:UDP-glucuronate 4-epimerase